LTLIVSLFLSLDDDEKGREKKKERGGSILDFVVWTEDRKNMDIV